MSFPNFLEIGCVCFSQIDSGMVNRGGGLDHLRMLFLLDPMLVDVKPPWLMDGKPPLSWENKRGRITFIDLLNGSEWSSPRQETLSSPLRLARFV